MPKKTAEGRREYQERLDGNQMKRIIAVLMVLFCLILVGCGNDSSTTSEPDISTQEETAEPEVMDNDAFIEEVKKSISPSLGLRDNVEDIHFDGRDLKLTISLEKTNALERFIGVTDKIISISEGYDLWDSITIDFCSEGVITKSKDDIEDSHFIVDESDIVK